MISSAINSCGSAASARAIDHPLQLSTGQLPRQRHATMAASSETELERAGRSRLDDWARLSRRRTVSASASVSATIIRGSSDEDGSWNTICTRRRRSRARPSGTPPIVRTVERDRPRWRVGRGRRSPWPTSTCRNRTRRRSPSATLPPSSGRDRPPSTAVIDVQACGPVANRDVAGSTARSSVHRRVARRARCRRPDGASKPPTSRRRAARATGRSARHRSSA